MKKNSFLGLFGISVACAMLVGGARAVEYPYEMFSFFVPDASDGCSPIIGTKDNNGCYTITPQTLVDGQCTPTTPVQNVCDGAKGDKGDNAPTPTFAIDGENLKMTVDGTTTTLGKVTGNDGVSACAPLVTKETGTGLNMGCTRTNIQKQKMVNGSCADDGSITNGDWICNGADGTNGTNGTDGADACPPLVTTQQGTGDYAECYRIVTTPQVMGENGCESGETSNATDWICPGAPGTSCNIISSEKSNGKSTVNLKCGDDNPTVLEIDDGQDGTACQMTATKDSSTGDLTFTKQCGNEQAVSVTMHQSDVANEAVNTITSSGTFATPEDVEDATSTTNLVNKLTGEFATAAQLTATNNALDSKLDTANLGTAVGQLGYATQTDITTAVSGKADQADLTALTSTVNGKLDANALETEVKKLDLGYATSNDITTAVSGKLDKTELSTEVGKLGYVTTSGVNTAVSNAIANDSTIVKTTDATYQKMVSSDDIDTYITNAINTSTCTKADSRSEASCTGVMANILSKLKAAGVVDTSESAN